MPDENDLLAKKARQEANKNNAPAIEADIDEDGKYNFQAKASRVIHSYRYTVKGDKEDEPDAPVFVRGQLTNNVRVRLYIPEPIRVAHLIASGVTRGESYGKA